METTEAQEGPEAHGFQPSPQKVTNRLALLPLLCPPSLQILPVTEKWLPWCCPGGRICKPRRWKVKGKCSETAATLRNIQGPLGLFFGWEARDTCPTQKIYGSLEDWFAQALTPPPPAALDHGNAFHLIPWLRATEAWTWIGSQGHLPPDN
ncbi:hypothetical protein H1C71_001671 [Ictidomys tridecemlineatus]|nr:hypothetical protein H1C71_001671 [Ictidomys tridecemlineatus]